MSPDRTIAHSGVLFKRGYHTALVIRRKSWKPRYFVLTATTLQYYTFENGKLLEEIDLLQCTEESLEIMPADARKTGRSASTIWRLALNMPQGQRLLMAALTEREMNTWILHLTRALRAIDANASVIQQPTNELDMECQHQELASSWKLATTDFANFVSQPRRSAIYRRNSTESLSAATGLQRHSTGQIDEPVGELASGRKVTFEREDDGGRQSAEELQDDYNGEALRSALQAFSAATSKVNDDEEDDVEGSEERETLVRHSEFDGDDYESEALGPQDEVATPVEQQSVGSGLPRRRKRAFGKTRRHSTTEIDGNLIQTLFQSLVPRPSTHSSSTQTSTASPVSSARSSLSTDTGGQAKGKWIGRLKTKWQTHREESERRKEENARERDPTENKVGRQVLRSLSEWVGRVSEDNRASTTWLRGGSVLSQPQTHVVRERRVRSIGM